MKFFPVFNAEKIENKTGKGEMHMSNNKRNVWVTRRPDGRWNVKREGAERASHVTNTQREANEIAREIARNNKVDRITQGVHGQIVSHDSFGNDPKRIKRYRTLADNNKSSISIKQPGALIKGPGLLLFISLLQVINWTILFTV